MFNSRFLSLFVPNKKFAGTGFGVHPYTPVATPLAFHVVVVVVLLLLLLLVIRFSIS